MIAHEKKPRWTPGHSEESAGLHKVLGYSAWCDRFYIEPDLRDQWADIEGAEYRPIAPVGVFASIGTHWSVHVDGPLKAVLSGYTLAGTIGVDSCAEALALAWMLRTERAPLPEAACCDRPAGALAGVLRCAVRRRFTAPVNIVSRCRAMRC